jgi:hypothetical protein
LKIRVTQKYNYGSVSDPQPVYPGIYDCEELLKSMTKDQVKGVIDTKCGYILEE